MTVTITPNTINIYAMVDDYLVSRTYIGYTKQQAIELFTNEFKNGMEE